MISALRALVAPCAALALGCVPPAADVPEQPEPASGFAAEPEVIARRHLAVTANPHATAAAALMLAKGGSAVDAAIAAQWVLNLVEPQSSGIGGGGFMLVWSNAGRKLRAYDGRETAPASARPDRFADAAGEAMPFYRAAIGGRSVGTPGLVALLWLAHVEHGRLAWEQLFGPAIELAQDGFALSPRLHRLLEQDRFLRTNPAARALYYEHSGSPRPIGSILRNPELAKTLRELARHGPEILYRGPLGARIVEAVRTHPERPGDLASSDLAAYRARERQPVCAPYRRYSVCGMPPPSSGGVTTLQILGILERLDPSGNTGFSPTFVHRFAEAGRLAYADRAYFLADPDLVAVPVGPLLDRDYLRRRADAISDQRSMSRATAGDLNERAERPIAPLALEYPATTHLSVVDSNGDAVALTSSIEDAFGSRIMAGGFLLNNQLTDFAFVAQRDGAPVANRVEAGKRPLSSMAPTMVFDANGDLYAVLGSPGGSRIINYVAKTVVALIDWDLKPGSAVAFPHFGSRNGPTELEQGTDAEKLRPWLEALGHDVSVQEMTSGLHLIVRGKDGWIGAADPRREGAAIGE